MIIPPILPTEAELDPLLDTYFTALLGSTQNQDWAVVLGQGTKVILYATGGGDTMWEFISFGTGWYSQSIEPQLANHNRFQGRVSARP
jgi:hypothetical protein